MINAQDLRIGNWVNRQYWNPQPNNEHFALDQCQVERINPKTANLLLSDKSIIGKYPIESILPIPLTPEILIKAGFANTRSNNYGVVQDDKFYHLKLVAYTWLKVAQHGWLNRDSAV